MVQLLSWAPRFRKPWLWIASTEGPKTVAYSAYLMEKQRNNTTFQNSDFNNNGWQLN
jgi:hypothetical protein